MKWTKEQRKAIEAHGGAVLVSAAAGSGKTAVLVQRVIRRMTDPESPCPADRFLIVTFTRAAAAQMREKISAALRQRIEQDPFNRNLIKQQMLLPFAKICTIDSFCCEFVRDNFVSAGVSPDFGMLDGAQTGIIRSDAVNEVVEKLYGGNDSGFGSLVEQLYNGRDDKNLIDVIYSLWEKAYAYPFPEEYLDSLKNDYSPGTGADDSVWGKTVCGYADGALEACVVLMEKAIELIKDEDELCRAYLDEFSQEVRLIREAREYMKTATWDEKKKRAENLCGIFERLGTLKRGYESENKTRVTQLRDTVKDIVKKKVAPLFCVTELEHMEDVASLRPVVEKLVEAVKLYGEKLFELKKQMNAYEFTDIEHFAVRLLVERTENGYKKTALARELSERYEEILVDEYQDVNKTQDILFESLSRNTENLFTVGDVKQCIYRFRQAMPEIFLERREGLPEYNGCAPAKIRLDRNFRSREGVTGTVNFIFSQIMSAGAGEIDYAGEELYAAAEYPENGDTAAQLHILSTGGETSTLSESRYIADLIKKTVENKTPVFENGTSRPAEYSDFCILARSDAGKFSEYARALAEKGIPAAAQTQKSFFETKEINFIISLLRVIDNPVRDVPLAAVLLSPEAGFTPDDLAGMRLRDRELPLFACMKLLADEGEEKCAAFVKKLAFYRRISVSMTVAELCERLIEESACRAVCAALPHGRTRRANLDMFLDLAASYESIGGGGLSGFLKFLDKLANSGNAVTALPPAAQNADCVKIMTVHKSKGLEFPFVILAGCTAPFNTRDIRPDLIVGGKTGIGLYRTDFQTGVKYDTLMRNAVKLESAASLKSEELRVMYVALTRAREKLIMVLSAADPERLVKNMSVCSGTGERIPPFLVSEAASPAQWLVSTLIRHPDAGNLRAAAGIENSVALSSDTAFRAVFASNEIEDEKIPVPQAISVQPDEELAELIRERLDYVYPFIALTGAAAKRNASDLSDGEYNKEYFASSSPSFMSKGGLTAAQRGTAAHTFMQYADFRAARGDIEKEIERLVAENRLTSEQAQSLNRRNLQKLMDSRLVSQIIASDAVWREREFTIAVPACEIYPSLPQNTEDESVVIQGVVDCAFETDGKAVIVDYKTDRVKSAAELSQRYKNQLAVYKKAFTLCTGIPVSKTLLYSFELGEVIDLDKELPL